MINDEYRPVLEKYMASVQERAAGGAESLYQTADEVAEVVMHCIRAEDPPIRARTSAWGEDLCELKTAADPDGQKLRKKVVDMFLGGEPV